MLQYQLIQCNSPWVRRQFCGAAGSPSFFANGHDTKSPLCYSPSCPVQCFLLRRPPCQGRASRSPQNTLGLLQTSIQSWLVSCTDIEAKNSVVYWPLQKAPCNKCTQTKQFLAFDFFSFSISVQSHRASSPMDRGPRGPELPDRWHPASHSWNSCPSQLERQVVHAHKGSTRSFFLCVIGTAPVLHWS